MTTVQVDLTQYVPRPWQRVCHQAPQRFKVLVLHRRAGKTRLALEHLVLNAVKATTRGAKFSYVAPFLKQAKAIAWGELKQIVQPMVRVGASDTPSEGELSVSFANGSLIRLFGADNPDAMRGLGLDGVVIDEVAQMKPEVWYDILQPTLADRQGWAWFLGTPKGINLFSELYFQAQKLDDWYAGLWTVDQTDSLPPEEVARLRRTTPEQTFRREFLCDFTASGDDQLISLADAMAATDRVYVARDIAYAPRVMGVDPARFGSDKSVIAKRQGLQCFDMISFAGLDNMQLAARVANEIDSWKPQATFIDAGAGSGVIDRLRQLGYDVIEVPFGGAASQPLVYRNRRTEMWCGIKEWIESGGALPDDQELVQDLATPIYWFDKSTGQMILEAKDDIKARLLRSPDKGDALALTFAHPVAPGAGWPSPDDPWGTKDSPTYGDDYDAMEDV